MVQVKFGFSPSEVLAKAKVKFSPIAKVIFIPYKNICKIGEDVILVELYNLPQVKKNKSVSIMKKEEKTDDVVEPITPQNISDNKTEEFYIRENFEK